MMVLLTIIGLGMLSLSTISLRDAGAGKDMANARANARIALLMAIGDVQKQAGSDIRVTAESSLLETPGSTATITNRHWTGVWRTDGLLGETGTTVKPLLYRKAASPSDTSPDKETIIDRRTNSGYAPKSQVLEWLVSNPSPATTLDPTSAAKSTDILLVGSHSVNAATEQVRAPVVTLTGSDGRTSGAYAWWVGDEGVKARFNLDEATAAPALANAPFIPAQEGISKMTGYGTYETLHADAGRTFTRQTSDLLTVPTPATVRRDHFHDISFVSSGVIADTQNGGLRRDLNALLETGVAAALGSTRPAINTTTALLDTPALQNISPKFGLLKTWNALSSSISGTAPGAMSPVAGNGVPGMVKNYFGQGNAIDTSSGIDLSRQDKIAVHPVIVDAGISYGVSLIKVGGPDPGTGANTYRFRLHYYPRVVLWNPYNVRLNAANYAVQIAMPHQFVIRPQVPGQGEADRHFFESSGPYSQYAYADGLNNIPHRPAFFLPSASFAPGEAVLFTANAAGSPNHAKYWGDVGGAATSIANFPLTPSASLPLSDSFFLECNATISLTPDKLQDAAYQVFTISDMASTFGYKQYWYKLFLVKGATGNGSVPQLWNDPSNYPPLQYILQTEDGAEGSGAPWYGDGIGSVPANVSAPLRETTSSSVPYPYYRYKWGHRFTWFQDTIENRSVRPGSYNTPFLDYNLLANQNLRAGWNVRSPVEVAFRASACAGRYTAGPMIDDPYGWDWSDPALAPVSVSGHNRVSPFGAPGQFGATTYPLFQLPSKDSPLLSMGMLQHAPLSQFVWHPGYAFGNSLADPRVPRDKSTNYVSADSWNTIGVNDRIWTDVRQAHIYPNMDNESFLHDLSFEANFALWDRFFLSSVSQTSTFTQGVPLPNPRMVPQGAVTDPTVVADLKNVNRAASRLMVAGAFNVNSTSEAAWQALIASFRSDPAMTITLADGTTVKANDVFSRLLHPAGQEYTNQGATDASAWSGYRRLTDDQITSLAKEIVVEVKRRGPFVSLADFVNRRLVAAPTTSGAETNLTRTGLKGALQAAIDRTTINSALSGPSYQIAKTEYNMGGTSDAPQITYGSSYPKPTFPLASGNPWFGPKPDHNHWADSKMTGAPAYLTQADLLQKLAPVLSARSDTFIIRSYGETRNPITGTVTARAWAEAIIQRSPTPIVADSTGLDPATGTTGVFGRHFDVVSFRWLNPDEI